MQTLNHDSDNSILGLMDICWILIALLIINLALSSRNQINYQFAAIPDNARVFYREGETIWEWHNSSWQQAKLSSPFFALQCEDCHQLLGVTKSPLIIALPAQTEQQIALDFVKKCTDTCQRFIVSFDKQGYHTKVV